MKESILYKKLKKQLKSTLLQRIESGSTGVGIPDIFMQNIFINGWIELKEINFPLNKNNIIIPYRPGQFGWLLNSKKHGGNIFLLCSVKQWKDYIFLFKNDNVAVLYQQKNIYLKASFASLINDLSIKDFL